MEWKNTVAECVQLCDGNSDCLGFAAKNQDDPIPYCALVTSFANGSHDVNDGPLIVVNNNQMTAYYKNSGGGNPNPGPSPTPPPTNPPPTPMPPTSQAPTMQPTPQPTQFPTASPTGFPTSSPTPPPTSSQSESSTCSDVLSSDLCSAYAQYGFCDALAAQMRLCCAATCQMNCDCQDLPQQPPTTCAAYSAYCAVQEYAHIMSEQCPATCNMCSSASDAEVAVAIEELRVAPKVKSQGSALTKLQHIDRDQGADAVVAASIDEMLA